MSQRLIVVRRAAGPTSGRCLACDLPMDALGCRILSRVVPSRAARRRTGIAEVVEVECCGTPVGPIHGCPCCASHPGAPCEHRV
jgi:hypothetical protein